MLKYYGTFECFNWPVNRGLSLVQPDGLTHGTSAAATACTDAIESTSPVPYDLKSMNEIPPSRKS